MSCPGVRPFSLAPSLPSTGVSLAPHCLQLCDSHGAPCKSKRMLSATIAWTNSTGEYRLGSSPVLDCGSSAFLAGFSLQALARCASGTLLKSVRALCCFFSLTSEKGGTFAFLFCTICSRELGYRPAYRPLAGGLDIAALGDRHCSGSMRLRVQTNWIYALERGLTNLAMLGEQTLPCTLATHICRDSTWLN